MSAPVLSLSVLKGQLGELDRAYLMTHINRWQSKLIFDHPHLGPMPVLEIEWQVLNLSKDVVSSVAADVREMGYTVTVSSSDMTVSLPTQAASQ